MNPLSNIQSHMANLYTKLDEPTASGRREQETLSVSDPDLVAVQTLHSDVVSRNVDLAENVLQGATPKDSPLGQLGNSLASLISLAAPEQAGGKSDKVKFLSNLIADRQAVKTKKSAEPKIPPNSLAGLIGSLAELGKITISQLTSKAMIPGVRLTDIRSDLEKQLTPFYDFMKALPSNAGKAAIYLISNIPDPRPNRLF